MTAVQRLDYVRQRGKALRIIGNQLSQPGIAYPRQCQLVVNAEVEVNRMRWALGMDLDAEPARLELHLAPKASAPAPRCEKRAGTGRVRCCEPLGHAGPHLYKCAGESCPGLPWLASNTPHPADCSRPKDTTT